MEARIVCKLARENGNGVPARRSFLLPFFNCAIKVARGRARRNSRFQATMKHNGQTESIVEYETRRAAQRAKQSAFVPIVRNLRGVSRAQKQAHTMSYNKLSHISFRGTLGCAYRRA